MQVLLSLFQKRTEDEKQVDKFLTVAKKFCICCTTNSNLGAHEREDEKMKLCEKMLETFAEDLEYFIHHSTGVIDDNKTISASTDNKNNTTADAVRVLNLSENFIKRIEKFTKYHYYIHGVHKIKENKSKRERLKGKKKTYTWRQLRFEMLEAILTSFGCYYSYHKIYNPYSSDSSNRSYDKNKTRVLKYFEELILTMLKDNKEKSWLQCLSLYSLEDDEKDDHKNNDRKSEDQNVDENRYTRLLFIFMEVLNIDNEIHEILWNDSHDDGIVKIPINYYYIGNICDIVVDDSNSLTGSKLCH